MKLNKSNKKTLSHKEKLHQHEKFLFFFCQRDNLTCSSELTRSMRYEEMLEASVCACVCVLACVAAVAPLLRLHCGTDTCPMRGDSRLAPRVTPERTWKASLRCRQTAV